MTSPNKSLPLIFLLFLFFFFIASRAVAAMAALLDSPAEILHSIFEHLPTCSLHALCLVNKRLHQIAEPLLYTGIELVWKEHRPPPIISLLRTIQNQPRLASHVQRLTLRAPFRQDAPSGQALSVFEQGGFHDAQLPPSIPTDGTDLVGFIATIQDIDPPFRDRWIQELQNGTMDAFVMLLLSYVQNITESLAFSLEQIAYLA
ncbi:hypothetical protein TgHK011_001880 [Trichoderma gracile]|nr:hypothetical protein TgHK011_001880 [Trichoderma gracile]